jgi:ribokinase
MASGFSLVNKIVKKPNLFIVGNACHDLIFNLSHLPQPGETINASSKYDDLGGKGLNQAISAQRAGADVRFIAPIGKDIIAEQIKKLLNREGISTSDLIQFDGPSDTSIIAVSADAENIIISDTTLADRIDFINFGKVSKNDTILLQGNINRNLTKKIIIDSQSKGSKIILNPAPFREAFIEDVTSIDMIVCNMVEAFQWTGENSIENAVKKLPAIISIITLGASGCVLSLNNETLQHFPAPISKAIDTTGAGDIFTGTLAAEWLLSNNIFRSIRLAIEVASEKVSRRGIVSAIPSAEDIKRLRRKTSYDA